VDLPKASFRLARPGGRLADALLVGGLPGRLHHLLDGSAFHLMTFNDALHEAVTDAIGRHLDLVKVHRIGRTGLAPSNRKDQFPDLVLVRPDGYVAAAGDGTAVDQMAAYLRRWLSPVPAAKDQSSEKHEA
jgi:hypothetical protein